MVLVARLSSHWGRLFSFVQVSGRQSCKPFSWETEFWVGTVVLVARWSWKCCFLVPLEKPWLTTFTVKIPEDGLVKGVQGNFTHICSGLLGYRIHWVDMVCLLGLSCKGHTGKLLHIYSGLLGDRTHQVSRIVLNGSLEKAVHWWQSEASACSCRCSRRQSSLSWYDRFIWKIVL